MTVPNKTYSLKVTSNFLVIGYRYLSGSSVEVQAQFSVKNIALDAGLDEMVRAEMEYGVGYWQRNIAPDLDHFHLNWGILSSAALIPSGNFWHVYKPLPGMRTPILLTPSTVPFAEQSVIVEFV